MIRVVIDVAAPEGLKARAFLRKRRIPLTRRAFRGAVCQWQTSRADRSEAETPVFPETLSALRGGRGL